MRYRLHRIAFWLVGIFVQLARVCNALQSFRGVVLLWLDDERRHASHTTVIERCSALLERCPKESRIRADLLWRRGFAFYCVGDDVSIANFLADLRAAQQIAEGLTDAGSTLGHIYGMFAIYYQQWLRDFDEALRMYHQACHELRGHTNRASTLISYATLLRDLGDFQSAQRWLEEAVAVAKDRRHLCCAYLELARVHHAGGDLGGAHAELMIALRIAAKRRYVDEEGDIHRQLARIAVDRKDARRAALEYVRAVRCYSTSGSSYKTTATTIEGREKLSAL